MPDKTTVRPTLVPLGKAGGLRVARPVLVESLFEIGHGSESKIDERRQLVVYHFMFDPSWQEGCPSWSFLVDDLGHLATNGGDYR